MVDHQDGNLFVCTSPKICGLVLISLCVKVCARALERGIALRV